MSQQDVFVYRSILIKIYKIVVAVCILSILIIVRINLLGLAEKSMPMAVFKGILQVSIPLSILIRLFFIVRPRIFSSYVLGPGKLLQRFKNKTKEIEFSSIEKITLSMFSPRFFGGFSLHLRTGQKFVFLSLLNNNHKILESIVEKHPELLEKSKFENYVKTSQLVELSWKRIKERTKPLPLFLFKYLAYPLIVAGVAQYKEKQLSAELSGWENFIGMTLVAFLIHFLVVVIINHFEEVFLNRKVDWNEDGYSTNPKMEKWVYFSAQVLFYAITLALAIVVIH